MRHGLIGAMMSAVNKSTSCAYSVAFNNASFYHEIGYEGLPPFASTSMTWWAKTSSSTKGCMIHFGDSTSSGVSYGVSGNELISTGKYARLLCDGVAWYNNLFTVDYGWHHYGIVFRSNTNVEFYVDGIKKSSRSISSPRLFRYGHIPYEFCIGGTKAFDYDQIDNRRHDRTFVGNIARFCHFNRALSDDEVLEDKELANEYPIGADHFWDMDYDAGSEKCRDIIGNWDVIHRFGSVSKSTDTPWSQSEGEEDNPQQGGVGNNVYYCGPYGDFYETDVVVGTVVSGSAESGEFTIKFNGADELNGYDGEVSFNFNESYSSEGQLAEIGNYGDGTFNWYSVDGYWFDIYLKAT